MFLVPTLVYGVLMVGRRFPTSEAAAAGVGLKTMLLEFVSPILILLLVLHALVGAVELGVDSWIQNITGSIMASPQYAKILFIWTSGLMFGLRFFAGPIVHKISPLGLLFVSAVIACTGLLLLGSSSTSVLSTTVLVCFVAGTIYGIGKTFFWPTMLGVVSERFPRGGALTLGTIGGIGMLSAGLLGSPSIGYEQDFFAARQLRAVDEPAYERYVARTEDGSIEKKSFLFFPQVGGLDGAKVATLADNGEQLAKDIKGLEKSGQSLSEDKNLYQLYTWWQSAKEYEEKDKGPVLDTVVYAGQMALTVTAAIPATMALGYLILIFYFRLRGGYKAEVLVGHAAKDEEFTGGTEGPGEG
jgi:MFS family permease